jgi:predicted HicB family RNase H-like nuclease
MNERTGPYSFRLPGKVLSWLTLSAKKNQRSVSNEIIFKLNSCFSNQYSADSVERFKKQSPTSANNEVFQFRLNQSLKESLKMDAKVHGNSLNQELVMRLFFLIEEDKETEVAPVIKLFGVKEDKQPSFEDMAILKMINSLDDKSKKAVISLIRNLTE